MYLKEYLDENNLKVEEFAKMIGYHRPYISDIMGGKKKPGKGIIMAIVLATKAQVSANELVTPKKMKKKEAIHETRRVNKKNKKKHRTRD